MAEHRRRELDAWLQAIQQSLDAKNKPPVDRSIEAFIGPGCLGVDEDYFCPVYEGAVAISLYRLEGGTQRGKRKVYRLDSIEEAISWLSRRGENLSDPEGFDGFFKE